MQKEARLLKKRRAESSSDEPTPNADGKQSGPAQNPKLGGFFHFFVHDNLTAQMKQIHFEHLFCARQLR